MGGVLCQVHCKSTKTPAPEKTLVLLRMVANMRPAPELTAPKVICHNPRAVCVPSRFSWVWIQVFLSEEIGSMVFTLVLLTGCCSGCCLGCSGWFWRVREERVGNMLSRVYAGVIFEVSFFPVANLLHMAFIALRGKKMSEMASTAKDGHGRLIAVGRA